MADIDLVLAEYIRMKRNKHNAATGIISGSVDTGQPVFVVLDSTVNAICSINRKKEGPAALARYGTFRRSGLSWWY